MEFVQVTDFWTPPPFLSNLNMILASLLLINFYYFRDRLRQFLGRALRLGGRAPGLGQVRGPGAAAT